MVETAPGKTGAASVIKPKVVKNTTPAAHGASALAISVFLLMYLKYCSEKRSWKTLHRELNMTSEICPNLLYSVPFK